jgi:hypothetical protein
MTSSTILIQRAAELVTAFNNEHARSLSDDARTAIDDGGILVQWRLRCVQSMPVCVSLVVYRHTDGLIAYVDMQGTRLSVRDARTAAEFYTRVVDLAERIEALR